uniref:RNA polymerase II-associated protein 1 n=1 Tax=Cacopsylla melanoneura TaxID=428564 RepID=A0A8D8ZV14_9HEMI
MESGKRKLSLFAQSMQAKRNAQGKVSEATTSSLSQPPRATVSKDTFGETSVLLCGQDKDVIHQENIEKLAKMTTEQILSEQEKLLSDLDPGLVEFLKSKRMKGKPNEAVSATMEVECEQTQPTEVKLETIPDVVSEIANKWPHMDVIEDEKLKWIEDVKPTESSEQSIEAYNARFDFEGTLLKYKEENVKEGLYHHGEEPDRPGYTIQELLHLSRSSILQQRMTSINTLANILHKSDSYSAFLNSPIKPQLMDNNIYLMLRFSLDDNSKPIISPTLHALKELFVNFSDELCLDRCLSMYKLKQPNFHVNMDDFKKEEKEIKDEDYVKIDLVRGSMRTELLKRLSYILNMLNPDSIQVGNIIQILIRMARHSVEICAHIIQDELLFKTIHKLLTSGIDIYTPYIVKLYRILFTQSIQISAYILQHYDITSDVINFINDKHAGHIKLVIECLYYLSTLGMYGLKLNEVAEFSPVLLKLLDAHMNLTGTDSSELDMEHCAALVHLINVFICHDRSTAPMFTNIIIQCTQKWLSQSLSSPLQFTSCSMLSNALLFLTISQYEISLKRLLTSRQFSQDVANLSNYSWLLNGTYDKGPDSLPQLGSVPMILHRDSIFPLLNNLLIYLKRSKEEALILFASCEGLLEYVRNIVLSTELSSTANHYYASYEIQMLVSLIDLHHECQSPLHAELMHGLSLILMSIVQNQHQHLLSPLIGSFVFEEKYFISTLASITSRVEDLSIQSGEDEENVILNEAITRLPQIKQYYQRLFNIPPNLNPNPVTLTLSEKGIEPMLPCDWVYLPIMKLYDSEGEYSSQPSTINSDDITLSLQWILILESLFPHIVSKNSITARYCRLSCTFLADNDLFRGVTHLLQSILKCLLKKHDQFDFKKPVEGLSSFYDFYRELLEQFVGVSYGDHVFGEFILVPLHQRHDCKYKQLLWSELAATLRFLSTPLTSIGVPLQVFLHPCESDASLLNTYLFCLATDKIRETWCPVLYRVALHHISVFIQTNPEDRVAHELRMRVEKLGNKELRDKILNYVSPESPVER